MSFVACMPEPTTIATSAAEPISSAAARAISGVRGGVAPGAGWVRAGAHRRVFVVLGLAAVIFMRGKSDTVQSAA
ncbi:hypothetical protein [Streptomyces sp. NBC_00161]|uniref:hypothetical protein n=1 Tax=Streptomyces sp. NBC_00161 TaxID=2975671 RepID=UPI003863BE01